MIVFEDCGFGDVPVMLREKGYNVIGGSSDTAKMESNRKIGGKIAEIVGIKVPKMHRVKSLKEGIQFIKDNPGRYCLKQEGEILDSIKGLNSISKLSDGKDLIDQMEWLDNMWVSGLRQDFILQDFVEGYEVAMGAYWNGKEFMKDKDGDEICEWNMEHKKLAVGDRGTATGELFTLIRFCKAKNDKLFQETLEKLKPALLTLNYKGCVDINTIISNGEVHFLEFTNRFGSPATSGHLPLMKGKWGDFLYACSRGEQIGFEYNPDWLIVSMLVTNPFPAGNDEKIKKIIETKYEKNPPKNDDDKKELLEARLTDSLNLIVQFKDKLTDEENKMINLDYVYKDGEVLKVSNSLGYSITVNGIGKTPEEAGKNVEKLLDKVILNKGFFRNDWTSHYDKSKDDLTKWGYLLTPEQVKIKEEADKKQKSEIKRKEIRSKLKQIVYAKETVKE